MAGAKATRSKPEQGARGALVFDVHGTFRLTELQDGTTAWRVEQGPDVTVTTRYFDTPDLRLARDGIVVRWNRSLGSSTWSVTRTDGRAPAQLAEIPATGNTPPAAVTDLLTARLRGTALEQVGSLRSRRVPWTVEDQHGGQAVVTDDTVSLLHGARVHTRFRQVVVTPSEGAVSAADVEPTVSAVSGRLITAGARTAEVPFLVRVLGPQVAEAGDLPVASPATPSGPASDLVLQSVRSGLDRIVAADLALRLDHADAIHQVRVACRRLRSDLRTFLPLLDDPRVPGLRDELGWLGGALGDARDLEVLRSRLARTATADPVFALDADAVAQIDDALARDQGVARSVAVDAVHSERYVRLLDVLVETARAPVFGALAEQRAGDVAAGLVRGPWNHLARRARQLTIAGSDESWHRVRILAKRARYAAEAASGAMREPAERTARAAATVQELLGEHQDAASGAERFLAVVGAQQQLDRRSMLTVAVTAGRLAERERARIREVRTEFPAVWRSAARRRNVDWLRE